MSKALKIVLLAFVLGIVSGISAYYGYNAERARQVHKIGEAFAQETAQ